MWNANQISESPKPVPVRSGQRNLFAWRSPSQIVQVFHHFELCEEFSAGMWRSTSGDERISLMNAAANLMIDCPSFLSAMLLAVRKWPNSCEANLSNRAVNRRAWLGHAGCCIATGSPEDVTRQAWHTLTQEQQDKANAAADEAIAAWEESYLEQMG